MDIYGTCFYGQHVFAFELSLHSSVADLIPVRSGSVSGCSVFRILTRFFILNTDPFFQSFGSRSTMPKQHIVNVNTSDEADIIMSSQEEACNMDRKPPLNGGDMANEIIKNVFVDNMLSGGVLKLGNHKR